MATSNPEVRVQLKVEGLEDLEDIQAAAELIAKEIERKVAEERAGLLRILAYLAFEHGDLPMEPAHDDRDHPTGRRWEGVAELRIPDRVHLLDHPGDVPNVTVWRDTETDETVYRFRRPPRA
jgi:hypothetical protein